MRDTRSCRCRGSRGPRRACRTRSTERTQWQQGRLPALGSEKSPHRAGSRGAGSAKGYGSGTGAGISSRSGGGGKVLGGRRLGLADEAGELLAVTERVVGERRAGQFEDARVGQAPPVGR